MDPSTTAHIDPATLNVSAAGSDNIPVLTVHPTGGDVPTTASTHRASSPPTSAKSTGSSSSTTGPAATGLRQRVNNLGTQLDAASDHPAVKNAKGTAQKQISQLREILGRSPLVRDLEKRTQVDRVILVVGGVFAYLLLIPLNLFGLALPTTTLLTLLPPSFLALGILEQPQTEKSDAATRALLAYFVTLGFIQFLESLAAGVLEKRIPQYYTLKLLFLAYLLHPRTQGALKFHEAIFKPILARAQSPAPLATPPQSKESGSSASSPTFQAQSSSSSGIGTTHLPSGTGTGVGLDVPKNVDAAGNVTKNQADGEGFAVVSELH